MFFAVQADPRTGYPSVQMLSLCVATLENQGLRQILELPGGFVPLTGSC